MAARESRLEEHDQVLPISQGQRKQGQSEDQADESRLKQQYYGPRYKYRRGGEQGSHEEKFRKRRKPGRDRSRGSPRRERSSLSSSSSSNIGPTDTCNQSTGSTRSNVDVTSTNSSELSPNHGRPQSSTRPTRATRRRTDEQSKQTVRPVVKPTSKKQQSTEPDNGTQGRRPQERDAEVELEELSHGEDLPQIGPSSMATASFNNATDISGSVRSPLDSSGALATTTPTYSARAHRLGLEGRNAPPNQRVVRQSYNTGPDTTATLQPLAEADPEMWLGTNGDPDVLLSVPNLGVDRIYLDVEDLNAHVDLHAKVLDLLELHVGADVGIKKVELEIDNVRVQAMLKVRLNEVEKIIGRVVDLLEHHPEILSNLTGGLGRGLEAALSPKRNSGWSAPPTAAYYAAPAPAPAPVPAAAAAPAPIPAPIPAPARASIPAPAPTATTTHVQPAFVAPTITTAASPPHATLAFTPPPEPAAT